MFFKSIVTLEGMGRAMMKDFNFLAYSLEFAAELLQSRTEPAKLMRDLTGVGRDVHGLLSTLPRHLKQIMRKISSPDFAMRIDIQQIEELKKAEGFEKLSVWSTFVLTPLIYFGGVFHSAQMVPQPLRFVTYLNPIFYLVSGLRYGMTGVQDAPILVSMGLAAFLAMSLFLLVERLFRIGYKLRT